ncbi:MAG: DinB family protein [Bryobacterales bacterium]|nr:DinB family protein [Bryobacterales bacterium]
MKQRLEKVIGRSVEGRAWHGPSVKESIAGLNAEEAAWSPEPNLHSAWKLMLHLTAWMEEVTERMHGRHHNEPLRGDFPDTGEINEESWGEAQQDLETALKGLLAALEQFPEERLMERTVTEKGPGLPYFDVLAGVARHNAYHAGQIVMMRRMR